MNYGRTLWIIAACIALVGCGQKAKKPSKELQAIHRATASVLAEQVNSQVPDGGSVLFAHRQAAEVIARSWLQGLADELDGRFTLVTYGLEELSEDVAASFEGDEPLAEAMRSHEDVVAVITAIDFDPRKYRTLPLTDVPMFALEWPDLETAGPLFNVGLLKAGIFEREQRGPAPEGSSMEEIMSPRYLLATTDNWKALVGQ